MRRLLARLPSVSTPRFFARNTHSVNRREALRAAVDLTGELFTIVRTLNDSSWQHEAFVEIDGVPCVSLKWSAFGDRREDEQIDLELLVVGAADDPGYPQFWTFCGPPDPLFDRPPLFRGADAAYRWVPSRARVGEVLADVVPRRFEAWRSRATSVLRADADRWVAACQLVASLDNPRRWMVRAPEETARDLRKLRLPVERNWEGSFWTAAWLGLAPVLGQLVEIDAEHLTEIQRAAHTVRTSPIRERASWWSKLLGR